MNQKRARMNVKRFKEILETNPIRPLYVMLPDGAFVPEHFHITEVGYSRKEFVDCGGTKRLLESCILQVWVANDYLHRLDSSKLGKIMKAADSFLSEDLSIVVEYGEDTVAQYPLKDFEVTPGGLLLVLGRKPTECLAPDKCGIKGCC